MGTAGTKGKSADERKVLRSRRSRRQEIQEGHTFVGIRSFDLDAFRDYGGEYKSPERLTLDYVQTFLDANAFLDNDRAVEIFSKALQNGQEEVKNIRLMVLGMFGMGKTSLVNNLIKDFREQRITPDSTEGIDLHRCKWMDNGDWCLDREHKERKYQSRFKMFLRENKTSSLNDVNNFEHRDTESLENIKKNVQDRQEDKSIKHYIQEIKEEENSKPDKISNKETVVSVWDFAGQTLYYSTHQFFLNKRSLYLVVMDMTKALEEYVNEEDGSGTWCGLVRDCTYLEVFKFWLNAIHMYSGYQSSTKEEKNLEATVIFVGTCKDKMKGSEQEKKRFSDLYFEKALSSFDEESPVLDLIHSRKFLVNNLSPGDSVFGELRDEIKRLAERQDHWGEKSPIRWIHMEQSLDKMRDEGQQLIQLEKIEELNKVNVHPLGGEELNLFLQIQHMHGNILYFNTNKLRQLVVIDPQWIIEAFQCFIDHVPDKKAKLLKDWKDYTEYAILKPTVFNAIMDNSPHIGKYRDVVISYMEHLNVMAQPLKLEEVKRSRTIEGEDGQYEADEVLLSNPTFQNFHIVPCLLKQPPLAILHYTSPSPTKLKTTAVLCFVFCEKFMPPSFFHRLVAACIRTWPINKQRNTFQLYNIVAIFDLPSTYTLIVWYQDHIIYARIASCSTDHSSGIDFKLCRDVRNILRDSLLNFVGQSLDNQRNATAFDECIQCPRMKESLHSKGLFRVSAFMFEREIKCTACDLHAMERSEALQDWYKEALDRIDNDDDLNTIAEESHLLKASSVIGREFWLLGKHLGLSDGTMNQLYDAPECRKDHRTFVLKYMEAWKKKEAEKATLQRLNRAINAARIHCSNAEISPVIW